MSFEKIYCLFISSRSVFVPVQMIESHSLAYLGHNYSGMLHIEIGVLQRVGSLRIFLQNTLVWSARCRITKKEHRKISCLNGHVSFHTGAVFLERREAKRRQHSRECDPARSVVALWLRCTSYETKFCDKICVWEHYSSSTLCILLNRSNLKILTKHVAKFNEVRYIMWQILKKGTIRVFFCKDGKSSTIFCKICEKTKCWQISNFEVDNVVDYGQF